MNLSFQMKMPTHQNEITAVESYGNSQFTLESELELQPLLSGKPEYGYQDPQPITDSENQTVEPIFSHLDDNFGVFSEMSPVAQELVVQALHNEALSTITIDQASQLSLDMVASHSYEKLIQQPGFDDIQPIPDSSLASVMSDNQTEAITEAEALSSLTDAIKHSIASQQDASLFDVSTETYLSQSELDEINQLAAHQALINQS